MSILSSKWFRLLIAAGVLAALITFVGGAQLAAALSQVSVTAIFLLLTVAGLLIWVSALKWRLFIEASGHSASTSELMALYTVGYFFSTFTPSYVGGDIARSFHLGRRLGSQRHAFAATFLERFTGLLAMALLGVASVTLGSPVTAGVEAAILLVGAATGVLALVCFLNSWAVIAEKAVARGAALLPARLGEKVNRTAAKVFDGMQFARNSKGLFLRAMFLSLIFHGCTVLNTYVAALAVGWSDPSFVGLFVVVPLVLLVGMAPITPSGLGIQEGAFVFFLERIGCPPAAALGVGIVLRAKVFVLALVGALVWSRLRTDVEAAAPIESAEPVG